MKRVNVIISNEQKKIKIPVGLRLLIRKCCVAALRLEKIEDCVTIGVLFVDNERIKAFNNKYRSKNTPTDVLSFSLNEEKGCYDRDFKTNEILLGDIVISMEQADKQAQEYGHDFRREVAYLTVHAVLHLLGYTHKEDNIKRLRMREKEETIMTKLGLKSTCNYVLEEFI
ncbi:MAG: rRNA maturation RNase YbeY [Oscillospiraceae bacterium]|jgi:probable rRNA maturation factor|nr:rRNA maturation RNase YbeY [Oscillospiraceae bacterium]